MNIQPQIHREEVSTGSSSGTAGPLGTLLSAEEVRAGSICLQTPYPQGNCCSSILLFTKAVNMESKKRCFPSPESKISKDICTLLS